MYSIILSHSGTLMYSVMLTHSGTLMYSTMGSHSGTLMYSVMLSHSGTLMYSVMLSHSGTLMYSVMLSHSGTKHKACQNGSVPEWLKCARRPEMARAPTKLSARNILYYMYYYTSERWKKEASKVKQTTRQTCTT